MRLVQKKITDLYLLCATPHEDDRGSFRRNFCIDTFAEFGIAFNVYQGNISENNQKYTLRGFHFQRPPSAESKVITPVTGALFNVVIDLRRQSKTYLMSESIELRASNKESLLVPAGCANGFLTLENHTIVQYYMGDRFAPDSYRGFRYDDPFFDVQWPAPPSVISVKDLNLPTFSEDLL
jgi:dTDP-4-dehydrorhamnose 3,5-epimerase